MSESQDVIHLGSSDIDSLRADMQLLATAAAVSVGLVDPDNVAVMKEMLDRIFSTFDTMEQLARCYGAQLAGVLSEVGISSAQPKLDFVFEIKRDQAQQRRTIALVAA